MWRLLMPVHISAVEPSVGQWSGCNPEHVWRWYSCEKELTEIPWFNSKIKGEKGHDAKYFRIRSGAKFRKEGELLKLKGKSWHWPFGLSGHERPFSLQGIRIVTIRERKACIKGAKVSNSFWRWEVMRKNIGCGFLGTEKMDLKCEGITCDGLFLYGCWSAHFSFFKWLNKKTREQQ